MLRLIQASRLSDRFHGLLFQSDGSTCFPLSDSHGRSLSAHLICRTTPTKQSGPEGTCHNSRDERI